MIDKKIKKLLFGSLGIFFLYKSYKYMASVEYMNHLSNQYEITERIHKNKIKNEKKKKDDLEVVNEKISIINVEPYVVIHKDMVEKKDKELHDDVDELSYLELGTYLHQVGSL